jgi:hypothetical protein
MGHIFISYSHKDRAYVHKLQDALQNEGFEVWIDDRIDYGTRWPKVIQDQLDSCSVFIVVVSENSYESEWVQNEVARAKRKVKPIFPLLLSGEPWISVETTQYLDVRNQSLPRKKFYSDLASILRKEAKPRPVVSLHNPQQEQMMNSEENQVEIKAVVIGQGNLTRKFRLYFNTSQIVLKFEFRYYADTSGHPVFVWQNDEIVYHDKYKAFDFILSVDGKLFPANIQWDDDKKFIGIKLSKFVLKINEKIVYSE